MCQHTGNRTTGASRARNRHASIDNRNLFFRRKSG